jgi:hypothetical protein
VIGAAFAIVIMGACRDHVPTAPQAGLIRPTASVSDADSLVLLPLARGVALALANDALRVQVLEDLRDTPFGDHTIHAASYLAGPRGRPLLEAAALALGQRPEELISLAARSPDLAFELPAKLDRVEWRATPDVVVVATARTKAQVMETGVVTGFNVRGDTVSVYPNQRMAFPVLAILRVDAPFGADPEATRRQAPRRGHSRVSTHEAEYGDPTGGRPSPGRPLGLGRAGSAAPKDGEPEQVGASDVTPQADEDCGTEMSCICHYNPSDPRCQPSEPPPSPGVPLPSGFYDQTCRSAYPDYDGDGVGDQCEYELARAFRPQLSISSTDWTTAREPYWAVYPTVRAGAWDPYQYQIFYALSYYEDDGTPRFYQVKGHQGDSEYIVARVRYYGYGRWVVNSFFLTAHYGDWGDSSVDLPHDWFEWAQYTRGRARIYVSEDKHANYKSRGDCDRGANWADNCDRNRDQVNNPFFEVEVLPSANLGNVSKIDSDGFRYPGNVLQNCVYSRVQQYNWVQECFWQYGWNFTGWQHPSDGYRDGTYSTPYYLGLLRFLYR